MHRLEHLKNLVRERNAEAFAEELSLDRGRIRTWFDQGFPAGGYDAEVITALGNHVLDQILATTDKRGEHAHD